MPSPKSFDQRAEVLWKWALRLVGIAAFAYILISKGGNVPLGVFVIVGGLIGLPNIISAQQLLNSKSNGNGE
jgi:hypothetical protein